LADTRADVLRDWRAGRRERVLWIEYDAYARRVFAGAPDDWLGDARRYAATLVQAHVVLPTEVLSLEVLAPYLDTIAGDERHPLTILEQVLESPSPASFADEVVDALVHRFAGRVDLVLKIGSPADLLIACGASQQRALDVDDLDDCATLLAAFVRRYAERPVGALQITSSAVEGMREEEIEACAPLVGAAAHYGWLSVFAFERWRADTLPESTADVVLLPEVRAEVLTSDSGRRYGGGLTAEFWNGRVRLERLPALLHGRVPENAEPETVLAQVGSLTVPGQ